MLRELTAVKVPMKHEILEEPFRPIDPLVLGALPCEKMGHARREILFKLLKETNLGVTRGLCEP